MTDRQLKDLYCELSSLSVFRGILKTDTMSALLGFLRGGDRGDVLSSYGQFVSSLSDSGCCFSDFLRKAISEDENPYIAAVAKGQPVPDVLENNAKAELRLLSHLTRLTSQELCESLDYSGYLPQFENHPLDLHAEYTARIADIGRCGYGIFASAGMFRVDENGDVVPVESADTISEESFVGYEDERRQVFDNTIALTEGRPAANVLLCGDAGTGKSSTVKACANALFDRGVRLIELRKDQLFALSGVMGRIADNPLKFIIFIDDLSFNKNDDCFSMLKAALEGSASAKAANAVIYATSNRRHIVKESFSDREGDDVHRMDTMQELMSLSDRFGLTVYFGKPDKALYLRIVHALAERCGVTMPLSELDTKAEAYALSRGGRSPRAAEHFIKSLM